MSNRTDVSAMINFGSLVENLTFIVKALFMIKVKQFAPCVKFHLMSGNCTAMSGFMYQQSVAAECKFQVLILQQLRNSCKVAEKIGPHTQTHIVQQSGGLAASLAELRHSYRP